MMKKKKTNKQTLHEQQLNAGMTQNHHSEWQLDILGDKEPPK